MKKSLHEARADLDSGIVKSLNGGKLTLEELEELSKLTVSEMIKDHDLDSLMAEKVLLHAQSERYRVRAQHQYTGSPDGDLDVNLKGGYTRSHPVHESRDRFKSRLKKMLKEMHSDDGRMMDYGHTKSDSHEGRSIRQALYDISRYGSSLHDTLRDADDLPQWCHYKVATARSNLAKVKHYLDYKIFREGDVELE